MNRLDEFETVIRRKDGKVTASVPQLALYSTATDINAALDGLERKKSELLTELIEADRADDLERAIAITTQPAPSLGLWAFTIKVGIVTAVATLAVVLATHFIAMQVETALERSREVVQEYSRIGGREFWSNVEKNLDKLADAGNEIPEHQRQKILSNIRVIKQRWWPFVEAAVLPPSDARGPDRDNAER